MGKYSKYQIDYSGLSAAEAEELAHRISLRSIDGGQFDYSAKLCEVIATRQELESFEIPGSCAIEKV